MENSTREALHKVYGIIEIITSYNPAKLKHNMIVIFKDQWEYAAEVEVIEKGIKEAIDQHNQHTSSLRPKHARFLHGPAILG